MRACAVSDRECGFTVVELLVAVVISGLIVGAGATVLVQGLTLTPESQERTVVASRVTRLTDVFSDDVANARQITAVSNPLQNTSACSGGLASLWGPFTIGPLTDAVGVAGGLRIVQLDGTVVLYRGVVRAAARGGHSQFAVVRTVGSQHDVLATGWCPTGTTPAPFSHSYDDPALTTTLRIAPSPGTGVSSVVIGANRRTTG